MRLTSIFRRRRPTPGAAPGALVINRQSPRPIIRIIDYNATHLVERVLESPQEVIEYLTDGVESITWIDVQGLGNAEILKELALIFDIHPLALEDVVHVSQRPKLEPYPTHQFIISRMVEINDKNSIETEQMSIFLGSQFVLTFQEFPGDCFDPLRERLRRGGGILRRSGADYLVYSLLDAVIDHYFPVIERIGEYIEELEDSVVTDPRPITLRRIHRVKSNLMQLRRAVWPQRDVLNSLIRDESTLFHADTRVHLRDCYDHTVQVMDVVESYRDIASGLLDIYMSSVANRTNDVMKVLTMVSTVFIPLTFIAGVYGMNFETSAGPLSMPELKWPFGYVGVWALFALIAAAMLILFMRLGWIRLFEDEGDPDDDPAGQPSQPPQVPHDHVEPNQPK